MTFEKFFKKKKINLPALQNAEGVLFAEFKEHYELMGEKSFDHTKKYWFNKLRRLYPLPPEVKAEKVVMENKLAEQAITESLAEPAPKPVEAPKTGFTPRFRAGAATTKPAAEPEKTAEEPSVESKETTVTPPAAKPGFTPRFKAGVTKPAYSANEEKTDSQTAEVQATAETKSAQPTPPTAKPGFTPRFKAGVTKPAPSILESKPEESNEPDAAAEPGQPKAEDKRTGTAPEPPKGFKPRFKPGVTKQIPSNVPPAELDQRQSATMTPEVNEAAAAQDEARKANPDADVSATKPDFQKEKEAAQEEFGSPERLNRKLTPEEGVEDLKPFTKEAPLKEEEKPTSTPPKIGFKPRFKPKQ
ncbi:hypothetical protein MUY27_20050 [Mucilaginibacter sp. RS28]|uniref:Uncharacterized protein n=1 Tax=Mucilaginibacter straminoryzae TaxID=2932774 RepID=A0A9X1X8C3_9SPHI|nr:hypothetical protein [Mucilaginibacter straminoryzae]MCJ8212020.1 hypothetical protein [Mucilaginibacter straminoryzae]